MCAWTGGSVWGRVYVRGGSFVGDCGMSTTQGLLHPWGRNPANFEERARAPGDGCGVRQALGACGPLRTSGANTHPQHHTLFVTYFGRPCSCRCGPRRQSTPRTPRQCTALSQTRGATSRTGRRRRTRCRRTGRSRARWSRNLREVGLEGGAGRWAGQETTRVRDRERQRGSWRTALGRRGTAMVPPPNGA